MLGIPQQRGDARDKRGPLGQGGRDSRDPREAGSGRVVRDGPAPKMETVEYTGQARAAASGSTLAEASLKLDDTGLTLAVGGGRPVRAGYRDLSLIAIQQSTALLVLGDGPDAMRWMLEKFGDKLGPMVRELRELRLKQRLSDGLVQVPDEPAELVEFDWQPTDEPARARPRRPAGAGRRRRPVRRSSRGVSWSARSTSAPSWIHYRRASIAKVIETSPGEVAVDGDARHADAARARRGSTTAPRHAGEAARRRVRRRRGVRGAAAAGRAVRAAPEGVASCSWTAGRPGREEFGDAGWPIDRDRGPGRADLRRELRVAVLHGRRGRAALGGDVADDPGSAEPKIWFLIAMPGNLVALELVTAGAHATYFFRVMPRAQYKGEPPEKLGIAAEQAVRDISEALVDCRFLREPMALPADQLRLPKYLRYRLALAVLPSLAWARARFVARIVHRDPASWSAAVADLVRWHAYRARMRRPSGRVARRRNRRSPLPASDGGRRRGTARAMSCPRPRRLPRADCGGAG